MIYCAIIDENGKWTLMWKLMMLDQKIQCRNANTVILIIPAIDVKNEYSTLSHGAIITCLSPPVGPSKIDH